VILGGQRLRVGREVLAARPALARYAGKALAVGIRPEDLSGPATGSEPDVLEVTAELTEALGSDLLVHCGVNIEPVDTEDTKELARDAGTDEAGRADARFLTTIVGRFGPRARISEGDQIRVVVDIDRLHLFDLDTGASIAQQT
jgi:multiple sugar transport system ATP-binding protein